MENRGKGNANPPSQFQNPLANSGGNVQGGYTEEVKFSQPGAGQGAPAQGYQSAPTQGYAMQSQGQPGTYAGYPGQPQGQPPPAYTGQPAQMMARPPGLQGCPPGLEYLAQIDQLLIHQQVELMEVLFSFETQNRYVIKNSQGQQVFFAGEESDCCERQFCGPQRGFVMHITDNLGQEVMRISREFKCCAGVPCCINTCETCALEVRVESPPGEHIGTVKQSYSMCRACSPKYSIEDVHGQTMLDIEGPGWVIQTICCTDDLEFQIQAPNSGAQVGKISKQWGGFLREAYTNADNFSVSFPMELDVKTKAVMIGAVFLIDFMHFEKKKNK